MNILYYETSSGFGGSASALANMVNHLNRKRYNPTLAITNQGAKIEKIEDAEIIKLKDYHEQEQLCNLSFVFYFLKSSLPKALKIYFIIRRKQISLIHINTNILLGIPAIIASKLAGIPCICHIRETRRLIKREKFFANWVDKFIVLNKDAYEIYLRDIPEKRLEIIYDGLDLNEFSRVEKGNFKQEFNLDSSPIVGTIGRIVEGKGQIEFILAAKEVLKEKPNAKFVVVGDAKGSDSKYFHEVKELVRKEGLNKNVIFTGWRNDIDNIISDLDILVLPSTTYPEGLPNVLIEAMVLNKPVIATNIPGPSDIVVNGKNGFLVPPADITAMAEKINYLLDNPNVAKDMGEKGRKRVEELFNIKKQVKKIEKLYEKVLSVRQ